MGEFRIPGNGARRLARAVRSPSADAASELLGTLTDRGEGDTEAVCRGADLPRDRRDQEQQRLDRAQRRVRRPEEAGLQDPAADGGLGGSHRPGGRRFTLILSLARTGPEQVLPSLLYGRCLPADLVKPIPRWDVHFEGLEDYRKDSTALHITHGFQLGGHRQCGLPYVHFTLALV